MRKIRCELARARRAWSGAGAICLVYGLAMAPAYAAPKISVETTRVEIGELGAGEAAEVEFPLTNTGTEPLKIETVEISCGCLTSRYPETLAPGEKGALKVKLVPNPLWSGPVEKPLTLRSNDPDQPAINLQVVARIRPLLRLTPGSPIALRFREGEIIRQVVTISSEASPPVVVTGVAPGGPGSEARLLPAEGSDGPGRRRVEVIVRPPEKSGDFVTFVKVQTTHPKIPIFPIVVHGLSDRPITVAPPILRLGALGAEARADPAWRFTLLSLRAPFRVLGVEADTPALQVQLDGGDDGSYRDHEVTVRYLGGWPKGKRAGKFVVTTDNPQAPKLEVPYEASFE
jgi:hypothetical protein